MRTHILGRSSTPAFASVAKTAALGVVALIPCLASTRTVWAGECTEGDDAYYVEALERIAQGKKRIGADDPFGCLDIRFGMTNRWAGPRAAKKIERFRKHRLVRRG